MSVYKRSVISASKINMIEKGNILEIESTDSSRMFPLIISIIILSAGILITLYEIFTSGVSGSIMMILLPTIPVGVGAFISAIASLNTRFTFDKERNTLTYSW